MQTLSEVQLPALGPGYDPLKVFLGLDGVVLSTAAGWTALFLEEESSPSSGSAQHNAIKSQEDFERIVSRPKGGKLHLAQRLHLWNTSKSASERTGDWTSALGSVELWRRQVDIWVDSLAYLRSAEKQQEGDGADTTKKAKTSSQVSATV